MIHCDDAVGSPPDALQRSQVQMHYIMDKSVNRTE